jgi:hypothetical protein
LHKTGGIRILPTIDTEEKGKYIIMLKKGKAKKNFNLARDWYNFEMRQYFEEFGIQKPGWPPTSTHRAGYRAVPRGSDMDSLCQALHHKVAQATAKQKALKQNSGGLGRGNSQGGRGEGPRAAITIGITSGIQPNTHPGTAWGQTFRTLLPPPHRTTTTIEDLELEHTVIQQVKETEITPITKSEVVMTPSHPQYQQFLDMVSDGLGVSEMKQTITTLQEQNYKMAQQMQELQNQTEKVSLEVTATHESINRMEQQHDAQVKTLEEKVTQSVTVSVNNAIQTFQQQQTQMAEMLQLLLAGQNSSKITMTAPTSVVVTSEHEVSSLTTEGISPTKRKQPSIPAPQQHIQKYRCTDDDLSVENIHQVSQPAGTPCTTPNIQTGEETRGDIT